MADKPTPKPLPIKLTKDKTPAMTAMADRVLGKPKPVVYEFDSCI